MAKVLKKSFKDSLEDIKELMKEKRNKNCAKLGTVNQVLPINNKITDNSAAQMKNFQANNRALALALVEEKSKMREAEDIILCLKKEYQSLKFQNFDLQRKLKLKPKTQHAENGYMLLKKIISKVVQDLLSAANILDSFNDVSTNAYHTIQYDFEHEECAGSLKKHDSLTLLRHILAVERGKEDAEEMQDEVKRLYSVNDLNFCGDIENTSSVSQADTGCQNYSCEDHPDHVNSGSRIITVDEDRQIDYSGPKNVSICHCLKINSLSRISESNDDIPETSVDVSCSNNNIENCEEISISQAGKHNVNIDKSEPNMQIESDKSEPDMQIESEKSESDMPIEKARAFSKQNFNNIGTFKIQKGKSQKRKSVNTKNMPKARSNKDKNLIKHAGAKQKADTSIRCNDAYDFISEESVHITPFRQNKQNEHDDQDYTEKAEICSDEPSVSEEDCDDSLYVPYSKKSKTNETLNTGTDVIPPRTKLRSKRTVSEQHDRNPEGENRNTKIPESHLDESSEAIHKHLNDITNVASTSCQTRISQPAYSITAKDTIHQRRRSTNNVSYKEPSINGKLRRGDPFTDTSFLHSPIFKERKNSKSFNKTLLSTYNEASVG